MHACMKVVELQLPKTIVGSKKRNNEQSRPSETTKRLRKSKLYPCFNKNTCVEECNLIPMELGNTCYNNNDIS